MAMAAFPGAAKPLPGDRSRYTGGLADARERNTSARSLTTFRSTYPGWGTQRVAAMASALGS